MYFREVVNKLFYNNIITVKYIYTIYSLFNYVH